MERIYNSLLIDHFMDNRQMALLSGPRQAGKTTCAKTLDNSYTYINWDNKNDREKILKGPDTIISAYNLNTIEDRNKLLIFDELHKYSKWKQFIKGFFDVYSDKYKILITGSARLNIYKKIGDSLMGRYFNYRLHPLSIAEIQNTNLRESEIKLPSKVTRDTLKHFLEFGGFPEPFLKGNKRFYNKWRSLRTEQLIYEDLREFSNIKEIASIEILAEIMRHQAGQLVNYSSISKDLNNSVDTVKRWFTLLEKLYYSFTIRPYFSNIPKSLRKQPKVYLWDWSYVADEGAKRENMIASHLLKAVHFWTDNGLGSYNLYFLRDKVKREVDFLVTKNEKPWILVEVKSSERKSLSPHLNYFNNLLNPPFAFQIDFSSDYIDRDCFSESGPIKVPAATFLSQLV